VLRLVGLLIFVAGAVGVASGTASGILVAVLGGLGWLAGHWHYALRHQEYKSPLARHLFSRRPLAWLDPTRDWVGAGRSRLEVVAVTCSGSPHRFSQATRRRRPCRQ